MAPTRFDYAQSSVSSPAKRQKTNSGNGVTSQASYNSADDSGDDLFDGYETIDTVPVARPGDSQLQTTQTQQTQLPQTQTQTQTQTQYVTQPTQLVERPSPRTKNTGNPSTVQVAASSPLRPPESPSSRQPKRLPTVGGVLASAMAPPGTAFCLPYGVTRTPVRPVIDLSDDEGPTFKGHSSDDGDDMTPKADIKPSLFSRSGRNGSDKNPTDRIDDSPSHGINKFKEITAQSFYQPSHTSKTNGSSFSGSVYDSRNRDESATSSRIITTAPKRSGDALANAYGAVRRPQPRQMGPQRAAQVDDIQLDSIADFHLRQKVQRIKTILPAMSLMSCRNALIAQKGNVEDALELLTSLELPEKQVDLTLSDDERPSQPQAPKPMAKRQLKAPNRTIQDKYSSTQAILQSQSPAAFSPPKEPSRPKKRLIRGRKLPSSPASEAIQVESPKPVARPRSPLDSDDSDSGIANTSADDSELQGRVLRFFNTCTVKDLADIANITTETAEVILASKPFGSLEEVRQISGEVPAASKSGKRKTTKRAIGDKIVDTCLDTWTGYEAVDELVAKCESIGRPIAEEMRRWGFDVYGAAKGGELEMVTLDATSTNPSAKPSLRDSGIGTPSSSPASPSPDDADQDVHDAKSNRQKKASFLTQPAIMSKDIVLKDYQLVGLNWLALLFDHKLSCILADEMGLGKTCQVISFLAHLLEKGVKGPHLVVVPGSTLENWLREFRRFCPALVVEPYYGLEKDRAEMRLRIETTIEQINVIVTTYDLASKKVDGKFLRHLKPVVCVYDEGHALKNSTSLRYAALMRIPAVFRLLLTGTPLQNNLKELAALLGFILPNVFNDRRNDLDYIFKHRAKTTDDNHAALLSAQRIARAKSMMTPFVLRRKKHQVLKHLPAKTSRVEYCDPTAAQLEVYEHEVEQARAALEARMAGLKPKNASANVMMQLRKAAIHPMLFRRLFNDAKIKKMARDCLKEDDLSDRNFDLVLEDMEYYSDFQLHTFCEEHPTTMSKYNIENDEWMDSGKVQKLADLLLRFRTNGDRVLVFSQFTMVLDILEAVMETLEMQYFRFDGQTKIEERQDMIDQFYDEPDVTVFLLSTKAGGMGINLACANKVIIFDQSFNPQEDLQAENRAHRVGQQREVEVIRLVTKGTIEEQIHALGETKLALDERVSGEGKEAAEDKEAEQKGIEMVKDMWLKGGDSTTEETKEETKAS